VYVSEIQCKNNQFEYLQSGVWHAAAVATSGIKSIFVPAHSMKLFGEKTGTAPFTGYK
jgi:hypothetical protein